MPDIKPSIIGLHKDEISDILVDAGQPSFRTDQILDWAYTKRVTSFEEMSNLPKKLRDTLEEQFSCVNMS